MSTASQGRRVLAIDPGNTESAFVVLDEDRRPIAFDKTPNGKLLNYLRDPAQVVAWDMPDCVAIEMVASYGMAVGAEVFDTCVWIGRYHEALTSNGHTVELVKRQPVKLHHCHDSRAKDSNIRQALVDRFAPGQPNHGKGTKQDPGWFHGFRADIWQAYALAVYVADTTQPNSTRKADS